MGEIILDRDLYLKKTKATDPGIITRTAYLYRGGTFQFSNKKMISRVWRLYNE